MEPHVVEVLNQRHHELRVILKDPTKNGTPPASVTYRDSLNIGLRIVNVDLINKTEMTLDKHKMKGYIREGKGGASLQASETSLGAMTLSYLK